MLRCSALFVTLHAFALYAKYAHEVSFDVRYSVGYCITATKSF